MTRNVTDMIRRATPADALVLAELSLLLWPDHTQVEMEAEFSELLCNPDCALFLAIYQEELVGFAQCQLRRDYVEGTESSPVGYLEGICVRSGYRHQGHARALLAACEDWAREMGCREFASDCELANTRSLAFHLSLGFTEANRIICFTKKL